MECLIEVFGACDFQGYSSIAQVHHTGRALYALADERVGFRTDQGDPLPTVSFSGGI